MSSITGRVAIEVADQSEPVGEEEGSWLGKGETMSTSGFSCKVDS